jgi:hypothetical protein
MGWLTIRFLPCGRFPLRNIARVLQIDIPAICLSLLVLERKSEYSISLLHGILALRVVCLERTPNGIKGF